MHLFKQFKDTFLEPDGSVKPGMATQMAKFEQEYFHGCRFMWNSFWEMRGFCVYTQTLPDSLHLSDLGLYQAILVAIWADCKENLFDWLPDGAARWTNAMHRLEQRLNSCRLVGTELPPTVCQVGDKFEKAHDTSIPLFKAWEFRLLMLVSALSDMFLR